MRRLNFLKLMYEGFSTVKLKRCWWIFQDLTIQFLFSFLSFFCFLPLLPDSITVFSWGYMHLINLVNQQDADLKEPESTLSHPDRGNQAAILDRSFVRWHMNHPYIRFKITMVEQTGPQEMFSRGVMWLTPPFLCCASSCVPIKPDRSRTGRWSLRQ